MIEKVRHIFMVSMALLVLAIGVVLFVLPIPLGIVLLLIGLAMLLSVSITARIWFRRMRKRYPAIDSNITKVEPHLPEKMVKVLRADS